MNTDNNNGDAENPITVDTATSQRTLLIDVDYYQAIIDDPQVSEARKRELIDIIGRAVVQFIDIGFGVHPVQQATQVSTSQETANQPQEKERILERIEP